MPTVAICSYFTANYPKPSWIEHGFRLNGWETKRIHTAYQLTTTHRQFDLVLFLQRPPMDSDELRSISLQKSCPWAYWTFDFLHESLPLLHIVPWASFDHIFAKNIPPQLDRHKVHYLDQAVPCHWHPEDNPPIDAREYQFLMPGTFTAQRGLIVARLIRDYRERYRHDPSVAVAGNNWPLCGRDRVWLGSLDKRPYTAKYIGIRTTDDECREMFQSASIVIGDNMCDRVAYPDGVTPSGRSHQFYCSDRRWLAVGGGSLYCGPGTFVPQCLKINATVVDNARLRLQEQQKKYVTYERRINELLSCIHGSE